MTILVVFGTRPEAIKLAPVIKKSQEDGSFCVKVCVTAQHRQMLDQVLNIFGINPDFDLNIMKDNQNLFELTAEILLKIREVIEIVRPDIVLVQGDTTTTFISSLAAFYNKVKVGHIEAGLRTGHKYSPFPEEINRKLITALADLHFAPTERAKQNLIREGISKDTIFVTGNTGIDALLMTVKKIKGKEIFSGIDEEIRLKSNKVILVTAHRRESFGERFNNICSALAEIVDNNPDVEIVYPVHLNPNVQEPVKRFLMRKDRIHLTKPLDYVSFVTLMNRAYLILTDSGGIQEEAPSLGKPVLVLREFTERIEAIEMGTAKLVGVNKDNIVKETEVLLHNKEEYDKMAKSVNPYGDGRAAERIIEILKGVTEYTVL
ncbi:MAG: UDP-N-acetylglucosamine 2-epimerase (non-hydrolyzing) [Candidatus Desulfofervidaceae bacterium]|nr:UDP-N-acetylglucosamine 2-epimerase (non-hydrolyzing) [Candidatus Desulfofervidaceae bacterium]